MAKFDINWSELVREFYNCEIEADSEEEAKAIWNENPYGGDFDDIGTDSIEIEFESISEILED
jgi:hypothetical protein